MQFLNARCLSGINTCERKAAWSRKNSQIAVQPPTKLRKILGHIAILSNRIYCFRLNCLIFMAHHLMQLSVGSCLERHDLSWSQLWKSWQLRETANCTYCSWIVKPSLNEDQEVYVYPTCHRSNVEASLASLFRHWFLITNRVDTKIDIFHSSTQTSHPRMGA